MFLKECREFLIELGYDTSITGGLFFVDLLEEVVCMLNSNRDDDYIKKMLPSLYIEYYHFYYEISAKRYFKELNYFDKNGYVLNNESGYLTDVSIEDKLIILGKKYLKENIDYISNQKVFIRHYL